MIKNVRLFGLEVGVGMFYLGAIEIEHNDFNAALMKIEKWQGGFDVDILFVVGVLKYMKYVH